ncbi:MAG: hypothetical protein IPI54_03815 [Chitinophagaceae bacterium]|nr:hypothetical protein [Chitinophagaceae bacterium]
MNEIEWHVYTPYVDEQKMKEMYGRAHDLSYRAEYLSYPLTAGSYQCKLEHAP